MSQENDISVESTALMIHQINHYHESTLSLVVHDVRTDAQGRPSLGAGRVLDEACKQNIIEILDRDINRNQGFIRPELLLHEPTRMVWFRKRRKTSINLAGEIITVPMPSLVFLLEQGRLSVVAIKGERRPQPTTRVFHSALPNVDVNGVWCSGGKQLPERPQQRHIERIETMFFEAPFTYGRGSTMATQGLADSEGLECADEMAAWHCLVGMHRFPGSRLLPLRPNQPWGGDTVTLEQWVNAG